MEQITTDDLDAWIDEIKKQRADHMAEIKERAKQRAKDKRNEISNRDRA